MTYTVDLQKAARRHLEAAQTLYERHTHQAEAAYLFGLAAECAVKRIAQATPILRTDDIFYKHFPELREILLDRLEGRSAQYLLALVDKNFLAGWSIKMRYAPSRESLARPLADWAKQAARAVNLMSGVA